MLIFEKINELKTLNENLKNELATLKETTKSEVESSTLANIQAELENAINEAKAQVKSYADEKINQTNADLEAFHARQVKVLFQNKLDEIKAELDINHLSQNIALEFAKQNQANATNALESIISAHTSDFVKSAKNEIQDATQTALNQSTLSL